MSVDKLDRFKAQFKTRHQAWNRRMISPWTTFSSYQEKIENVHERRAAYLAYPFVGVATIVTGVTVGFVKFLDWASYPFQWLDAWVNSSPEEKLPDVINDPVVDAENQIQDTSSSDDEERQSELESEEFEKKSSSLTDESDYQNQYSTSESDRSDSKSKSGAASVSGEGSNLNEGPNPNGFFEAKPEAKTDSRAYKLEEALANPTAAVGILKDENANLGFDHIAGVFKIYNKHKDNKEFCEQVKNESLPWNNTLSGIKMFLDSNQKAAFEGSHNLVEIYAKEVCVDSISALKK